MAREKKDYKLSYEIEVFIKKYTRYLNNLNKSSKTIESYLCTIKKFVSEEDIVEIKTFEKLDKKWWLEYSRISHEKNNVSISTINKKINQMSSFYNFLVIEEICSSNPCYKLPKINGTNGLAYKNKVMSEEQAKSLLKSTDSLEFKTCDDYRDCRNKLVIYMFLNIALRIEEMSNIKIKDIEGNKIYVRGKGHGGEISRYTNVNDTVLNLIHECIEYNPNREFLFENYEGNQLGTQSLRKIWYKACDLSKVPRDFTPHNVRHFVGSNLVKKGVSINKVSMILGHSKTSKVAEAFYVFNNEDNNEILDNIDIF